MPDNARRSLAVTEPMLALGQRFASIDALKLAVRAAAAEEGWNARVAKTTAKYPSLRCQRNDCPFFVHGILTSDLFEITRLTSEHTCLGLAAEGVRSLNGNHQLIVAKIAEAMVVTQQTSAKAIKAPLKHTFGLNTTLETIYKTKAALLGNTAADELASFRRIPAYVEALKAADADTHATYEEVDGRLTRLYVCPGASRHAWKYCRPWLAVDATFMKNKFTMRLHLAATMDATGALLVLAWALTPADSTENWAWFLTHLKSSLVNLDHSSTCVVSDRNLGLIGSLDQITPQAIKTWCCFHLAKNIKDQHHSAAAQRLFWKMVYSILPLKP